MNEWVQGALGHFYTIGPVYQERWRPTQVGDAEDWRLEIEDGYVGTVALSGLVSPGARTGTLLAVVHGLGGNARSHYAVAAAAAAERAGVPCFRFNLRGADTLGDDLYHAALTSDLAAALASPELSGFTRVVLLGYSIGGHFVLRFATEEHDKRVCAAAAVCPPLDLGLSGQAIDRPERLLYRLHVLEGMRAMHAAVARRGRSEVTVEEAALIKTLADWDQRITAPRWGFASGEDYHQKASVGPRLGALRIPSLFVGAKRDPMIPRASVLPSLEHASSLLSVRWMDRGGHVGFPSDLDLGFAAPPGLEPQVLRWLLDRADTGT